MKRVVALACLVCVLALGGYAFFMLTAGPLSGMVVVIDPGHGGSDPGAHGSIGQATINEDEYVHEVACRLSHKVESLGGTAVMTVVDPSNRGCSLDSRPQNEVIPSDHDEIFASDGSGVVAGITGLQKRVDLGNKVLADRWWRIWEKVVYISIHFDTNQDSSLEGVSFIAPEGQERELTLLLRDAFGDVHRLRNQDGAEHNPVVYSGDPNTGTIHVYVLSPDTNTVRQRILIELGNFENPEDRWRIRDANVRQDYANTIANGLVALNKLPSKEVRN